MKQITRTTKRCVLCSFSLALISARRLRMFLAGYIETYRSIGRTDKDDRSYKIPYSIYWCQEDILSSLLCMSAPYDTQIHSWSYRKQEKILKDHSKILSVNDFSTCIYWCIQTADFQMVANYFSGVVSSMMPTTTQLYMVRTDFIYAFALNFLYGSALLTYLSQCILNICPSQSSHMLPLQFSPSLSSKTSV